MERNTEISMYLDATYNKERNIEISMYLYADNRNVTRKFPFTFTQITCKEEHGNFHVSSKSMYELRYMQKDARK